MIEHYPIRVVIADDHPLIRGGLRAVLDRSPDINVVAVADDGPAALRTIATHRPHVVLLDIQLPGMSGVEVAREARDRYPNVAILILTGYDDIGYVRTFLSLGIQGYLSKTVSDDDLVDAIRTVATGGRILSSEALRMAGTEAGADPLTAREREVIELMALGRRNAEIAVLLTLSIKTVEYHVSRALERLGARSRVEAVRKARQLGLIGPEAELPREEPDSAT
jgi:DNA-binding NarL/FixJ family response regulator